MGITLLKSRAPSQRSLREAWMAARVGRDHASFLDLSDGLLARQPDSVPIRRAMARYHAEIGAHEQAAPHWASLRDLSSTDFEATFHLAKREVATGLGIGRAVEKADRSGSEIFNAYLRRVLEAPVARHDAPEASSMSRSAGYHFAARRSSTVCWAVFRARRASASRTGW
jgi:hypothetical protein